jgi:pSer/pThr/pTyr-binding forkhead associated (FHA) protein
MSVRLISNQGSWLLPEGQTVFGRSTGCGICVLDARLSRRHAEFQVHGSSLTIIDLSSTNGVLVNGRPITHGCDVHNGDRVVIGPCLLAVHIDSHPAPATVTNIDTEAIEYQRQSEAPTASLDVNGSTAAERHIDPSIAAAVTPSRGMRKSDTDVHRPSEYRELPSDAGPLIKLSASAPSAVASLGLSAEERAACLAVAHNSAATIHDEPISSAILALSSSRPRPALPGMRLAAGILDAVQTSLVSLLVSAPILVFGYALALNQAKAIIHNGLPYLAGRGTPASMPALAGSLLHEGGIAHAVRVIGLLQTHFERTPFLTLYVTVTLSVLIFLLTHLLSTVVATVLRGGPFWHRWLGLTIIDLSTNAPPSWSVSLRRWFLLLVLWPLAPFSILRKEDGLHDRISGCAVRQQVH